MIDIIYKQHHQDLGLCRFYSRFIRKSDSPKYEDGMLVPIQLGTNMAALK